MTLKSSLPQAIFIASHIFLYLLTHIIIDEFLTFPDRLSIRRIHRLFLVTGIVPGVLFVKLWETGWVSDKFGPFSLKTHRAYKNLLFLFGVAYISNYILYLIKIILASSAS